jgi:hypothetical protein
MEKRNELEMKAKELIARIKRADEFKTAQEAISTKAREELREVLTQLGTDHFEATAVGKQVDLSDDYKYSFDIARILQAVPADELIKTKTVSMKSEGFDKLVRNYPDLATARTSTKKDEKKLTITAIKK